MIRNFLFHRVNPQRDKLWDPMDVSLFDKCIKYITAHYEVVLIEDLVERLDQGQTSKNKYATIMFDDGYKDNIEYAAPILDKYNCKASFYVVTDCIEKHIPPWTNVLEHHFQFTKIQKINMKFDFLPVKLQTDKLLSQQDRINYVRELKPFLKKLSHEERSIVLEQVYSTYNDVELPDLMMNWNDLKVLKKEGHYVGSHSVSHSMLGTMTNEIEVKEELLLSAKMIEKQLGYFPLSISYPLGSYNDTTKRISKEVGYKMGLAVHQKLYNPAKQDFFEIPRIELYNESWWKTRLRITHSLERLKSIITQK